jgi:hypothetical protein
VYDLSKLPPEVRAFSTNQIISVDRDEKWKHPPALANYNQQELADIIVLLRLAATGARAEIALPRSTRLGSVARV